MKPELKLGRKVIAWNNDPYEYKGTFISQDIHGDSWVLEYGDDNPRCFDNVKPDLTAEPMSGDMVEVSDNKKRWHSPRLYVGKTKDGRHWTEFNCGVTSWNAVRFPHKSKRDRVRELLESDLFSVNTIIDQIDYIYRDES